MEMVNRLAKLFYVFPLLSGEKLSSAFFQTSFKSFVCTSWVFQIWHAWWQWSSDWVLLDLVAVYLGKSLTNPVKQITISSFNIKKSYSHSLPLFEFETYFVFGEICSMTLVTVFALNFLSVSLEFTKLKVIVP